MRKTTMLITPVLAVGMAFGVSDLSPKAASVTTVKDGDTLWSISQKYEELSANDLLDLNNGLDPYAIPTGTEILLERINDNEYPADESSSTTHTIQPDNTLWNIASAYDGVTVEQLIELNGGIDPHSLQIGSDITISNNKESPNDYITHTVQAGNTLWNIAAAYNGVTVNELREANPNVNENSLEIGSAITVPFK